MSRRYAVITTCHAGGWDEYGRRMVLSFDRFWHPEIPLFVYAEGFNASDLGTTDRVINFDLLKMSPWLADFKVRNKETKPAPRSEDKFNARGRPIRRRYSRRMHNTEYMHDVVRFAHKSAAMLHAINLMKDDVDVLLWLDADTVTHRAIDPLWFDQLFPSDHLLGLLLREKVYPETGFIAFNLKDPAIDWFRYEFEDMYAKDGFLDLASWTDCHVIEDVMHRGIAEDRFKVHSLSGGFEHTMHPFINGPLGDRMDHLKGPRRKRAGRSETDDLRRPRNEEYWAS